MSTQYLRRLVIAFCALASLTVLAYLPSINGSFIYDDHAQIVRNLKLHSLSNIFDVIFNGLRQMRVWQNLTFAVGWWLSGPESWGIKSLNLLLHIVNGALFTWLLWRFTSRKSKFVLLATGLFLLHPLQTESVTYAMGAVSLWQAFFYFLLLLAHIELKRFRLIILTSLLTLSYLAKESCLLIPLVLVVFDLVVAQKPWRKAIVQNGLVWLLSLPLFIFFQYALADSTHFEVVGFGIFPYRDFLVVQLHWYFRYLLLVFSPWRQSILHPYSPPGLTTYFMAAVGLSLFVLLGFWLARHWRSQRAMVFWFGFFLVSMAPTNSFLQMANVFAEYRLYQANAALFVILFFIGEIVWFRLLLFGVSRVGRWLGADVCAGLFAWPKKNKICLINILLVLCATVTAYRCRFVWRDSLLNYKSALELYPRNIQLLTHVGVELDRRREFLAAREKYLTAVALLPEAAQKTALPIYRLARNYFLTGEFKLASETLNKLAGTSLKYGALPNEFNLLKQQVDRAINERNSQKAESLDNEGRDE